MAYYDLFAKYQDEKEERPVARMIKKEELLILSSFLLQERKRHFLGLNPSKHYVDYIRIE